jgi:hypothetical protein
MTFEEILGQVIAMLQRRGCLTYGALKRQFSSMDMTFWLPQTEAALAQVEGW